MDWAAAGAARWPGPSPHRSHPLSSQRCAPSDVLLGKRLWMQPGAHTTTVLDRLPQASQPVRLSLTARVNARSHRDGATHLELTLQAVPHGVVLLPWADGVPLFAVLSDRGDTQPG